MQMQLSINMQGNKMRVYPTDIETPPSVQRKRCVRTTLLACILLSFPMAVTVAVAGTDMYEFWNADGTLEATNVPTDGRFLQNGDKRRFRSRVSVSEVERAIGRYGWQYQLHPALLLAMIKAESDFNPTVISKAGAIGLMQLIPETAIRHGVENLYDTNENIRGGARHIRYLLDRFNGNLHLAVAAYNAGEGRVERYHAVPPYAETREYVRRVLTYYKSFKSQYRLGVHETVILAIIHKPLAASSQWVASPPRPVR
jgi:soluble lytic murein transglycosylase-like protein